MAPRLQTLAQLGLSQWRQYRGAMTPEAVRIMWMRGVSWTNRHTYSQVSHPMQVE
jgi:hypothetical protein